MLLKTCITGLLIALSLATFAQIEKKPGITAQPESKALTIEEKKEIQRIFDELMAEEKRKVRCSFLKINNLARAAATITENEAFSCLNSQMVKKSQQLFRARMRLEALSRSAGSEAISFFFTLHNQFPVQSLRASRYGTNAGPADLRKMFA